MAAKATKAKAAKARGTKAKAAKAAPKRLALGKVQRVILYVNDFDRAVKFYTETLGIPLQYQDEGWAALATQGTEIDLHAGGCGDEATAAEPGSTHVAFAVADLDATYAALKARGVKLSEIFSPCGGTRCASFEDLDGNCLGIEGK